MSYVVEKDGDRWVVLCDGWVMEWFTTEEEAEQYAEKMNKVADAVDRIKDAIADATVNLNDDEYLEVLEQIQEYIGEEYDLVKDRVKKE